MKESQIKKISLYCFISLISTINDFYQPSYGDTQIAGSIAEPGVLTPMLAGNSVSRTDAGLILNGPVKYHTDLSVIGNLAESWDISPDGLVVAFHLRK